MMAMIDKAGKFYYYFVGIGTAVVVVESIVLLVSQWPASTLNQ